MRLFALLIGARVRTMRNRWWRAPEERRRLLGIIILATVFAVGIFAAADWFFSRCLEAEPIGEIVVRRALGMVLLVVFSLLAFSSLIAAFSSLYLADDLKLLVPHPIPPYPLYAARFVDAGVQASWMTIPFSLPIFIAAGRLFGGGPAYYGALAVVELALAVIPTAIGVVVSLLLTVLLSARRARHVLAIAGSVAVGILIFILRTLEPEKLMHPDQGAPLIEALRTMQGLDPPWLPSSWALDALWVHLGWGGHPGTHPVALLLTTSAFAFFAAGWVFRALHPRAFSKAQEGLHRTAAATGGGHRNVDRLVTLHSKGKTDLSLAGSLRTKDRLNFVRDSAQLSQLLILGALVALYVLNFKYIRAVSGSGLVSDMGLHFLNLGLCGFVVLALGARFVFPVVSLEGPAFWLILSSPNTMRSFLAAKVGTWFWPMAVFANLLLLATHWFLGTGWILSALSATTITPMVVGVVGLGVGLGARYPRFDVDDPVAVVTGLGGVLFMVSGAALTVVVALASIWPTLVVVWAVERGRMPHWSGLVAAVACAAVVVVLPVVTACLTLRWGAKSLQQA